MQERDWYKRRAPNSTILKAVSCTVPDFKKEHNHFCDMFVQYDDGTEKRLFSRVIYNKLTDKWTIDGMHEAAELIE